MKSDPTLHMIYTSITFWESIFIRLLNGVYKLRTSHISHRYVAFHLSKCECNDNAAGRDNCSCSSSGLQRQKHNPRHGLIPTNTHNDDHITP